MVLPGVGVVPLAVPPPAHDPQQMEHAQYPVTRNLPRYVPLEELLLSVLSCAEALAPEPDVLELLLELWLLLAVLCCLAASSAAALAAASSSAFFCAAISSSFACRISPFNVSC